MSQEQQNIDLFLREYRELCERYGLLIDSDKEASWITQVDESVDMDKYIRYLRQTW